MSVSVPWLCFAWEFEVQNNQNFNINKTTVEKPQCIIDFQA